MCEKTGAITAATVCDHIDKASKNSEQKFFAGPFQSLCDDPRYRCHSSTKQQQETIGYSTAAGADSLPVDLNYPWNSPVDKAKAI
jgi:5-methylcytosine-specific restriction protein A